MSFLVVEASRACSAAIDFGNLFSSSFDFLRFHTARVIGDRFEPTADPTDVRHAPIAAEFCAAEQFRFVHNTGRFAITSSY
jgi:hypothetical protein